MPTWLRNFTSKQIQDYYNKQKDEMDKVTKGNTKSMIDSSGKVNKPEFAKVENIYKSPAPVKKPSK